MAGEDRPEAYDAWGGNWEEAKKGGGAWGGRGKGGRGLHRATYQPQDVHVEGVTLAYLGRELLERCTLKFAQKRRYGLIGRNGCGKTTLLSQIHRQAIPGWPTHLRTYLVQQEIPESSELVLSTILNADERLASLLQEESDLIALAAEGGSNSNIVEIDRRLEAVHDKLEAIDAFTAEERATVILKSLGFSEMQMHYPMSQLSGGWRMRVSIACCLFSAPDIMLLDEATNHLDLEGSLWLAAHLQVSRCTVVMVSHDRHFLDAVATDIVLFRDKQLAYFQGNYTAYQKARSDRKVHLQRVQNKLERERDHMEESIRKMNKAAREGDEKKSKQVASRRKKLDRHGVTRDPHGHRFTAQTMALKYGSAIRPGSLNESGVATDGTRTRRSLEETRESRVDFHFPHSAPQSLGVSPDAAILELRDISFSFTSQTSPLFEEVNLSITLGRKIGLLGENGSGKTTLLRLLLHKSTAESMSLSSKIVPPRLMDPCEAFALTPTSGEIRGLGGLRIGYYAQFMGDALAEATPLERMQASYPSCSEQELRARLGSFGLGAELVFSKMKSLSGGQRARVALAEMAHGEPHVLILDEPSNHLDMQSVEALATSLKEFPGALVLISHNISLLSAVVTDFYLIRKKRLQRLSDFHAHIDNLEAKVRRP